MQTNNTLHYFVNEVERGPSATLIGCEDKKSFTTFNIGDPQYINNGHIKPKHLIWF